MSIDRQQSLTEVGCLDTPLQLLLAIQRRSSGASEAKRLPRFSGRGSREV
jgi:hypothetical protein